MSERKYTREQALEWAKEGEPAPSVLAWAGPRKGRDSETPEVIARRRGAVDGVRIAARLLRQWMSEDALISPRLIEKYVQKLYVFASHRGVAVEVDERASVKTPPAPPKLRSSHRGKLPKR